MLESLFEILGEQICAYKFPLLKVYFDIFCSKKLLIISLDLHFWILVTLSYGLIRLNTCFTTECRLAKT